MLGNPVKVNEKSDYIHIKINESKGSYINFSYSLSGRGNATREDTKIKGGDGPLLWRWCV